MSEVGISDSGRALLRLFFRPEERNLHLSEVVEVSPTFKFPDFSFPFRLNRDEHFSVFIPRHSQMAAKLIEIFMDFETDEDLLSGAIFARDRLNSDMFIYALSVAILHRPNMRNLDIPPLVKVSPQKFVHKRVIREAKKEVGLAPVPDNVLVIPKDFSASGFEDEHRLAYFREDLGMNLHHWRWHLVYPIHGPEAVVKKDRRGELFYYMHQQMNARYNFERLANGLSLVKPFDDWQKPISEGYFSKLKSVSSSSGVYPGRQSGAILRDVSLPNYEFKIKDLERVRDRILESIHLGAVTNSDGERLTLTESDGINILGNIVESNTLSVNQILYGDLHNDGHTAIAVCHDPDNRHLEGMGVMGDNAPAVRDPIFYRWHAFIDNIFQEHKKLLKPYTKDQLKYQDIRVIRLEVSSENELRSNTLHSFWEQSDVDISEGLRFQSSGKVQIRFTHLNHKPFAYRIKVNNESDVEKIGTVRIFMAPSVDEIGNPLTFPKQRLLMVEMDKFTEILPPSSKVIERKSSESSVTIPFERTFPKVDDERSPNSVYCGCGWPQHMLLPKGNVHGFSATLFVMVSDFDLDKVDQGDDTGYRTTSNYCGLMDKKYPDARAMGYPFDRPLCDGNDDLATFKTSNMSSIEVKIIFNDGSTKSALI